MKHQARKYSAGVALIVCSIAAGSAAQAESRGALVMSGRTKTQAATPTPTPTPTAAPAPAPTAQASAATSINGVAMGQRFVGASRDWAVTMPASGWHASDPGKAFVILWGPDDLSVTVGSDYFRDTVQVHQDKFVADATQLGSTIESVESRSTSWSKGYTVMQVRPSGRIQFNYNLLPNSGTRKGRKNGVYLEFKAYGMAAIEDHGAEISAIMDSITINPR